MMIRYLAAAVMVLQGCQEVTCEDVYLQHECNKHSDCGTGLACVDSAERGSYRTTTCSDGRQLSTLDDTPIRVCAPGLECTTTSPVDLPPTGLCQRDTDCTAGQACNLLREPLGVASRCDCDKSVGAWDCTYDLAEKQCGAPPQCPGPNPVLAGCTQDAECAGGEKCLVSATETRPSFCACYEGDTTWQCESTTAPKFTCQPAL